MRWKTLATASLLENNPCVRTRYEPLSMISEDLETGRILLTPLTESHVSKTCRKWLIDPRVNNNLETRFHVPNLGDLRAYVLT